MTDKQRRAIEGLSSILLDIAKTQGSMGAPLGPMYAAFMTKGIGLEVFEGLVQGLVIAGKAKVRHHCLIATGEGR